MPPLDIPQPPIADDDGLPDPGLVNALADVSTGASGESVLAALMNARLFVPVIAVADEVENDERGLRREKSSSMASVSIVDEMGRRSMLAFTSVDELARFRVDARPVPVPSPQAAQAAIADDATALLIDISGESPFALVGPELLALAGAAGGGALNVGTRKALADYLGSESDVVDAFLDDGSGGLELTILLEPSLPKPRYTQLMQRLSHNLAQDRILIAQPNAAVKVRVVAANDQAFADEPRDTPSLFWAQ